MAFLEVQVLVATSVYQTSDSVHVFVTYVLLIIITTTTTATKTIIATTTTTTITAATTGNHNII